MAEPVRDALDLTFVLPNNPAAVSIKVGSVVQTVAVSARATRVTGLAAGQEYDVTLTVSDAFGNVSTRTDHAGPRVWIIGNPAPGVPASGSRNRPFASLTSARAATTLADRVWFSLSPGVYDAARESFPLQWKLFHSQAPDHHI